LPKRKKYSYISKNERVLNGGRMEDSNRSNRFEFIQAGHAPATQLTKPPKGLVIDQDNIESNCSYPLQSHLLVPWSDEEEGPQLFSHALLFRYFLSSLTYLLAKERNLVLLHMIKVVFGSSKFLRTQLLKTEGFPEWEVFSLFLIN
jgi:hypothetical protein